MSAFAGLIEPLAEQMGREFGEMPVVEIAGLSMAISLKRIADALDRARVEMSET